MGLLHSIGHDNIRANERPRSHEGYHAGVTDIITTYERFTLDDTRQVTIRQLSLRLAGVMAIVTLTGAHDITVNRQCCRWLMILYHQWHLLSDHCWKRRLFR